MRTHKFVSSLFATVLLLAGCVGNTAPTGWLETPDGLTMSVHGAWVDVEARSESVSGELIAMDEDSMYVADDHLRAIAVNDVSWARLTAYNPKAGGLLVLTLFGTLSTLSNGFYLIVSAPIWIITGTIVTINRSKDPVIEFPHESLQEMRMYARFPQGLPERLDRGSVRRKEAS